MYVGPTYRLLLGAAVATMAKVQATRRKDFETEDNIMADRQDQRSWAIDGRMLDVEGCLLLLRDRLRWLSYIYANFPH